MTAIDQYMLTDDEYVVLRSNKRTDAREATRPQSFFLTNKNVIYTEKSMLDKEKAFEVTLLSDIRVVNGRPQRRLDISIFMEDHLELSFKGGVASFRFDDVTSREDIANWIDGLFKLIVGHPMPTGE